MRKNGERIRSRRAKNICVRFFLLFHRKNNFFAPNCYSKKSYQKGTPWNYEHFLSIFSQKNWKIHRAMHKKNGYFFGYAQSYPHYPQKMNRFLCAFFVRSKKICCYRKIKKTVSRYAFVCKLFHFQICPQLYFSKSPFQFIFIPAFQNGASKKIQSDERKIDSRNKKPVSKIFGDWFFLQTILFNQTTAALARVQPLAP